jgi:hypothetical protein
MSLVVSEIIKLQTNDATKVLRLSQIEKFLDGSGYRCDLAVVSGGFSCLRQFFFDDAVLADAVPALRTMATNMRGKCVIKGQWEKDFIQLNVNGMGHVCVCGEICEYTEFTQHIKFAFRTDQTVLLPLARELQVLLDA